MSGLDNDPNYQAYLEAKKVGQFKDLSKVAWVLFIDGKYIGTAESKDEINQMDPDGIGYMHQPNAPITEVNLSRPRRIVTG